VAHLLAVAATVLEYGGDEDLAIAALLHDSVEDQGGKARRQVQR
jgi:(p)ppGpp synthase/HD superfamily hydrolase